MSATSTIPMHDMFWSHPHVEFCQPATRESETGERGERRGEERRAEKSTRTFFSAGLHVSLGDGSSLGHVDAGNVSAAQARAHDAVPVGDG